MLRLTAWKSSYLFTVPEIPEMASVLVKQRTASMYASFSAVDMLLHSLRTGGFEQEDAVAEAVALLVVVTEADAVVIDVTVPIGTAVLG